MNMSKDELEKLGVTIAKAYKCLYKCRDTIKSYLDNCTDEDVLDGPEKDEILLIQAASRFQSDLDEIFKKELQRMIKDINRIKN